jgi:hypothetical protein
MIGEGPIAATADDAATSAADATTRERSSSSKMKMRAGGGGGGRRHSSNNSNANLVVDDEEDSFSDGEEDGEMLTSQLLRKVPRRSAGLTPADREVVRLIGQHLTNIGLKTSADVLMQEAGCRLDQPTAATFRRHVMNGDWIQAVKSKFSGTDTPF